VGFWLVGLLGVLFLALVIAAGVRLWMPMSSRKASRADVGVALMTGAVVAIVVLLLEVSTQLRFNDIESRRAKDQARQALLLQVAVADHLAGARFSNEDLHDFYFVSKDLTDANFSGANLRNAIFISATLVSAHLDHADLRGANLSAANLQEADLSKANLTGGAILSQACLQGTDLQGATMTGADLSSSNTSFAKYDGETFMPDGKMMACAQAPCRLPAVSVEPDPCAPKEQ
jgi:uncharacterized protein YjbI with pentapeptide repeats